MGGSSNTTTTTSGGGGKDKDKDKGKDAPAAFTEGERVLAYHGPLLYEAKVALPFLHPPSPSPPRYTSIPV
jgi:mortality factor 4-like protein 1